MIKLRFSLDVEFSDRQAAMAYGVAFGTAISNVDRSALDICDNENATIKRSQIECVEITTPENERTTK